MQQTKYQPQFVQGIQYQYIIKPQRKQEDAADNSKQKQSIDKFKMIQTLQEKFIQDKQNNQFSNNALLTKTNILQPVQHRMQSKNKILRSQNQILRLIGNYNEENGEQGNLNMSHKFNDSKKDFYRKRAMSQQTIRDQLQIFERLRQSIQQEKESQLLTNQLGFQPKKNSQILINPNPSPHHKSQSLIKLHPLAKLQPLGEQIQSDSQNSLLKPQNLKRNENNCNIYRKCNYDNSINNMISLKLLNDKNGNINNYNFDNGYNHQYQPIQFQQKNI